MQPSRLAKTSDALGRYYTDARIAALLVQAMADIGPSLVLDLGAGSGALVRAAAHAWPAARFVTVDLDDQAASARLPQELGPAFTHHQADALDPQLAIKLGLAPGSADAAVCNPPYLKPRWLAHYADLMADAGLAELGPKLRQAPAELLFIAQNLRLLKDGGWLGLIIPDGLVAGERFAAVREALLRQHRIVRVIELPRRVFKRTDAKAHIVVLAKNAFDGSAIAVQRVEPDGQLSAPLGLTLEQAAWRLDYSFYAQAAEADVDPAAMPLSALGASVWRGRIASSQRAQLDYPVFHTTDFDPGAAVLPGRFTLSLAQAAECSGKVALPGDILLARIGRTLENKVCKVAAGPVAVSDSVLVLRLPPDRQAVVFAYLASGEGRQALAGIAHGVAARFITAGALLALAVPSRVDPSGTHG
jgi:type I restriction enzyme M protein